MKYHWAEFQESYMWQILLGGGSACQRKHVTGCTRPLHPADRRGAIRPTYLRSFLAERILGNRFSIRPRYSQRAFAFTSLSNTKDSVCPIMYEICNSVTYGYRYARLLGSRVIEYCILQEIYWHCFVPTQIKLCSSVSSRWVNFRLHSMKMCNKIFG